MEKILLIRFSSIGDVTQCLSVPSRLRELNAEIHWVTRADLAVLLEDHPAIDRIWRLRRDEGFSGLWRLILELRKENYTAIYDAHNNLRSRLICWALRCRFAPPRLLRRSLSRWKRYLLLKWKINRFRKPFSGQRDLLEPLKKWGLSEQLPPAPQIFCGRRFEDRAIAALEKRQWKSPIGLAPSAAYTLKRWPLESFGELIRQLPDENFWIFGGPEDNFVRSLREIAPNRVEVWAGHLNLAETTAFVSRCRVMVCNDTGVLHIAEQLGKPSIALMGPAPFGFPSRTSTQILERELPCRPCSKHGQGPCVNPRFQLCLRDISPAEVAQHVRALSRKEF